MKRPFDELRLAWHDYPGEWFTDDPSGPEERNRRSDTFLSLLRSDVALLLVDGQKLLDYADEEERYLKSLLGNFRQNLMRLKDDLLAENGPLVEFPRIWILALSKADLFPDWDVSTFRDHAADSGLKPLKEVRPAGDERVGRLVPTLVQLVEDEHELIERRGCRRGRPARKRDQARSG